MTECIQFQSQRSELANTRFHTTELAAPAPGEVIARVDRFALTANNITYGVAGDSIGYWRFFPADDPWGLIPVWGFAEVVESAHDGVAVGERIYGYLPMATHVRLAPERVAPHGWVDGVAHRQALPPVYNQYLRTAADPAWHPEREGEQMIYRPLFTTSFFLDDFIADNDGFGAETILIVSASSKTAIGLAYLLHRDRRERFRLVGLTSARNADFVAALGIHDEVVDYDAISKLDRKPAMIVDMAGNAAVRRSLHAHLGAALRHDCAVGITHWRDGESGAEPLPGPAPEMFFAPTQIQKRMQAWGRETFDARTGAAWAAFLEASASWIDIRFHAGRDPLVEVYRSLIDGSADPALAHVHSLSQRGV